MAALPPPKGIYVPVPTFFKDKADPSLSPALDLATQCKHAIFLARSGIRGIVLVGSTGEAVHLTSQEQKEIISTVRQALEDAGFSEFPIIAGTASQTLEEVCWQLSQAKEAGAQYGLVLAPGFFATSVSQEGLIRWYEVVANKSPIPILLYNYPAVSNNVTLQPDTIERLSQLDNVVGCKLSHVNLDDHALVALSPHIDHSKFHTFTGLGQQLIGLLDVGGAGAIDGLAGCFPRTFVKLYDLFEAREQGRGGESRTGTGAVMRQLQYLICKGEKMIVRWGSGGVKEILRRLKGMGTEGARYPLNGSLADSEWGLYKEAIEALEKEEVKLSH